VAITDSILALKKEQEQSSWVKDLIDKRYQPQVDRVERQPVGFTFKRDPFDPSSYYKQTGSLRDISRGATGVVTQEAANKKNEEAKKAYEASQKAIQGISPRFTGGDPTNNLDLQFSPTGKSRKYGLKGVTPNTSKAADYWGSKYGITSIGGYREHGSVPGSDHPKGRALDFMINNLKNGTKTGTSLANDLIQNYKAWNIKYVIWNRYIWSPDKGWRKYSGPSDHTDHVHASFNQ
jgi:hypothetical protein